METRERSLTIRQCEKAIDFDRLQEGIDSADRT
jgi:hypothetical protein